MESLLNTCFTSLLKCVSVGSDMYVAHLCSKQTIHYSCCTILLNAIAYNVLESAGVLYRLQTVNHVTDARIKVHKSYMIL